MIHNMNMDMNMPHNMDTVMKMEEMAMC